MINIMQNNFNVSMIMTSLHVLKDGAFKREMGNLYKCGASQVCTNTPCFPFKDFFSNHGEKGFNILSRLDSSVGAR